MFVPKVLIIDDDKEFLSELKDALDLNGYTVFITSDSLLALDIARAERPNVIVMDIRMEGMDGFQVAQKLKQYPETSSIPIIAISGYFTREEDLRLMKMHGIESCLNKPFNPSKLILVIESKILKEANNKK